MDAFKFVADRLRDLDKAIADGAARVVADADEEALHDLRVAIRRLRVLLKLARPIFSRFYADAVREPFTQFHRATSELRDEEVLEATLHEVKVADAAFHRWIDRRNEREKALRKSILHRVEMGELDGARRKLEALLELPVKPKRHKDLATFARAAVVAAQKEVEKLRNTPTSDAEGLHNLRIAYKNLRYTAELLADALPLDLKVLAEPAKKLQTRLGELHDIDVAITTVRAAHGLAPTVRTKSLRALRLLRQKRVAEYVAEMGPIPTNHQRRRRPRKRRAPVRPARGTLSRP